MKKNLRSISLFIIFFLTLSFYKSNAQTAVSILYAADSTFGTHCPPPYVATLFVYGTTTGYTTSDSIAVQFNFGDGSDSTVIVPVNPNLWFAASVDHSYFASGQYSVEFIATGPDGSADTSNNYSEVFVGDTCGNVSGTIYIDVNDNCIYDAGDTPLPWMSVQLLSGTSVVGWSYSDSSGNYYFDVPTGIPYTIQMSSYYINLDPSCPASGTYSIATAPSSGNDFALTCPLGYDLTGNVSGWGFRPAAQPAVVYVHASNLNCTPTNGQAQLILDPLVTYISANPAPTSINGDTLTWDFSNLSNYWYNNWWNSFSAYVSVSTSPSAVIGDTVCFTLTEESIAGDADPANNIQEACYAVRNSWDPNDKAVLPAGLDPGGRIPPSATTPMEYTIRFQNTGNDIAYNVFIRDTMDADLDMSTFFIRAASHQVDVDQFPGNVVKFSFNNIMLPDSGTDQQGSNGYVTYTINQKPNLPNGTLIQNTAGIYFDFNAPVITNTTINTIDDALAVYDLYTYSSLLIYPNPASTKLTIENGKLKIGQVEVFNVFGQKVLSKKISASGQPQTKVDISSLNPGIYFMNVTGEQHTWIEKFVKE